MFFLKENKKKKEAWFIEGKKIDQSYFIMQNSMFLRQATPLQFVAVRSCLGVWIVKLGCHYALINWTSAAVAVRKVKQTNFLEPKIWKI